MDGYNRQTELLLERLVRVETKLDVLLTIRDTADKAKEIAQESHQLATSAQKRLDRFDANIQWMWRTIICAIITGTIALWFGLKGML